jgi:hypothetical protein
LVRADLFGRRPALRRDPALDRTERGHLPHPLTVCRVITSCGVLMGNSRDLTGCRFGKWVVTAMAGTSRSGSLWRVRCDCGVERVTRGTLLRGGKSMSCGCSVGTKLRAKFSTHGKTHSSTWNSWKGARYRCRAPASKDYDRYGGRGVLFCERWESFENFLADMGEKPPGKTLDRYPDPNGNYEPSNCRWATPAEQARNRRNNTLLTFRGHTATLAEWSETLGLSGELITYRLRHGWSVPEALETPAGTTARTPVPKQLPQTRR